MNIIERLKKEKLAVNCKTKAEAVKLIEIFHSNNLKWEFHRLDSKKVTRFNEKSVVPENINEDRVQKVTCYSYNSFDDMRISCDCKSSYEYYDYEIIEFEEFEMMVNIV